MGKNILTANQLEIGKLTVRKGLEEFGKTGKQEPAKHSDRIYRMDRILGALTGYRHSAAPANPWEGSRLLAGLKARPNNAWGGASRASAAPG
jgi:hypothetical protein